MSYQRCAEQVFQQLALYALPDVEVHSRAACEVLL